MVNLYFKQQF